MKLVILDGYTENPGDLDWSWLSELVDEYTVYPVTKPEDVIERCKDADIVVTNKTVLSSQTINSLPKLKFIGILATGFNTVDGKAARDRGIPLSNIPAYSTDGVAQLVFALMLEMTVGVAIHNESVKRGEWCKCEHFCYWKKPISQLCGKTLGIVGFGKIGSAVAKIALAFGMKVIAFSKSKKEYSGVEFVSLDYLTRQSDFISLHCPLTDETRNLANSEFFDKMKPTAYLINTSRGPVVDEAALATALKSGAIAGAGVDVLCNEPASSDNPLLTCENCLITPHIAWASFEARSRLMDIFRQNVEGFVKNKPINVVN